MSCYLAACRYNDREDNGNPLQYSCLENLMDRGAWQDIVNEVTKRQTQLSDGTHTEPVGAFLGLSIKTTAVT